jgi:hypothetical protein
MKKPKNRHGKKILNLLPSIRYIIKELSPYRTPLALLLSPGLASCFSEDGQYPITFDDRLSNSVLSLQKKHKKINLCKLYDQIWKEDFHNFCLNNYKVDPRR